MNIKSNKAQKSGRNMNVGEYFSNLTREGWYWIPITVWSIIGCFVFFLEATWGIYILITGVALAAHLVIVGISEQNSMYSARWNDRHEDDKMNIFGLFGIPFIMLFLSYPMAIKPMINDYNTADRFDKVIPMSEKIEVFYNDENRVFVLFVEGKKQPLLLDRSGSTESYNRLKAGYLDDQIKIVKKETKGWTDTNSTISYHFDDYTFD